MAGSTRLTGGKLSLLIGPTADERKCDITAYDINNEEKDQDVTTFCDVEEGDDRDFFLTVTLTQSLQSTSFWRYLWENAGTEDVAFTVAPHGNETPTSDQPHFIGTLTIPTAVPNLGGEAGKDNDFTSEVTFELDGKPTLDTGA